MTYNPNMYMPYAMQQQKPTTGPVYVNDIDDVKNYAIPADSMSPPLMLESDNIFFIKEMDKLGSETIHAFKFEEIPIPSSKSPDDYVTRADFDAFTAKVMEAINGKHAAQESQS